MVKREKIVYIDRHAYKCAGLMYFIYLIQMNTAGSYERAPCIAYVKKMQKNIIYLLHFFFLHQSAGPISDQGHTFTVCL